MKTFAVSIIEPVGGHGGMNYYDEGLASGLTEAGVQATVYTCDENVFHSNTFSVKPVFSRIYGPDPKILRALRFVKGLLSALRDSRRESAAIAHWHFFHLHNLELMCVFLSKLFKLRNVATIHDVESFGAANNRLSAGLLFTLMDGIIVHNLTSHTALLQKYPKLKNKIHIIRHGNYLPFISPKTAQCTSRMKLGLPDDKKILLFFGQIKSVKGLDLLLLALAKIVQSDKSYLLVVAGKIWKDDITAYEKIIEEHALAPFIHLHLRYIPDEEVSTFYSAADLVVLPYRKIFQSGVLLMAMSEGCNVLASDIPGMTEIITQGETGFLFESEDVSALTSAISDVFSDSERKERVKNNALKMMQEQYSWEKIGLETRDFYMSQFTSDNC